MLPGDDLCPKFERKKVCTGFLPVKGLVLIALKLCSAVSEYRRLLMDPLEGPSWSFMDVEGVSGKELLAEEDRGSEDSFWWSAPNEGEGEVDEDSSNDGDSGGGDGDHEEEDEDHDDGDNSDGGAGGGEEEQNVNSESNTGK